MNSKIHPLQEFGTDPDGKIKNKYIFDHQNSKEPSCLYIVVRSQSTPLDLLIQIDHIL